MGGRHGGAGIGPGRSGTILLHEADPAAGTGRLFASAMRIGRDHIASSVYTLVLAYAGSALPLLLLVDLSRQPLGMVLTGDEVAAELLRGLIGAIALVASVPITTALAAALVARRSDGRRAGGRRSARRRRSRYWVTSSSL